MYARVWPRKSRVGFRFGREWLFLPPLRLGLGAAAEGAQGEEMTSPDGDNYSELVVVDATTVGMGCRLARMPEGLTAVVDVSGDV